MKRTALLTAYLTVVSLISWAQLPASVDDSRTSVTLYDTPTRTLSEPREHVPSDNLPSYPGGSGALQAYFQNTTQYPNQAKEANLTGQVEVRFRVMPTGHLAEFRIVQSCGPQLDRAALEAVMLMPRWLPAHRAGEAVSSLYQLLITFTLD